MKTITGTINGQHFSLSGNDREYPTLKLNGTENPVHRELAKRIIRQARRGETDVGEVLQGKKTKAC